jgi:N-acyl-D-aspartate/D-glutamate deacylase
MKGVYPDRAKHTFSLFLQKTSQMDVSIESAIARLTGIPARVIGLAKRGIIQSGAYADLVLLSRDLVPSYVWVNGNLVVEEEKLTAHPQTAYGKILKKGL